MKLDKPLLFEKFLIWLFQSASVFFFLLCVGTSLYPFWGHTVYSDFDYGAKGFGYAFLCTWFGLYQPEEKTKKIPIISLVLLFSGIISFAAHYLTKDVQLNLVFSTYFGSMFGVIAAAVFFQKALNNEQ